MRGCQAADSPPDASDQGPLAKCATTWIDWSGMTYRLASATLAAAALLVAPVASATIMIPLTIEDMTARATSVVRAKVIGHDARWDAARKHIHTYTTLEILTAIHGPGTTGAKLVVRALGGAVGEIGMKVAGTAKFRAGEEVVVFVAEEPLEPGHFRVVGMSQGKYEIRRAPGQGAVAVPSLEGVAFAAKSPDGVLRVDGATPGPGQIALVELERRVRAVTSANMTPAAPSTPAPATPVDRLRPDAPATTGQ